MTSPTIKLKNARYMLSLAEQACPHQDIDGYFDTECADLYDCCYAVLDAQTAVRSARKAYRRAEDPK